MRGRRGWRAVRRFEWLALTPVLVGATACRVYDTDLLERASRSNEDEASIARVARDAAARDASDASDVRDASAPPAADGGGSPGAKAADAGAMTAAQDSGPPPRTDSGGPAAVDAMVLDECPGDTSKTAPGVCGCGVAENCAGLQSALVHRYRFQGVGTTLVDSRSAANGQTGSRLTSTSVLELSGADSSHATLPAGLLSALSATTIEFWLTWQGGSARQPAISFGTATPRRPSNTCAGSAGFFSGSWYHFCLQDGTTTWSKSRGLCEAAGGFLASIESAAEDQFLDSHPAFTESTWIGANDLQTEGEWHFARASGLSAGTHFWSGDERGSAPAGAYEDWRRDPPNPADADASADCAFIFKPTASWTAWPCEYNGSFVCEWRGHRGSALDRGVFFTPADSSGLPALRVKLDAGGAIARGSKAFPVGEQIHVALVLDPRRAEIALYLDGALAASAANSGELTGLRDVDNWLGRSHDLADPGLSGSISELRIYDRGLTALELATSKSAGTDPLFLE